MRIKPYSPWELHYNAVYRGFLSRLLTVPKHLELKLTITEDEYFIEKVAVKAGKSSKCFSKKKASNHNNTVNITTRNVPFLDLNTENSSEVTNKAPFLELYSHYLELKNEGKATLKKASLESLNYDQYAHYKVNPYPNSAIMGYVERKYSGIRFTISSINIYPDVPSYSNTLKINRVSVSLKRDRLPTTDELTTSLYNAHKQKILRQKNNSSFGLTKANQKKLASYAKKLNTTEKKALNKVVKTMLD